MRFLTKHKIKCIYKKKKKGTNIRITYHRNQLFSFRELWLARLKVKRATVLWPPQLLIDSARVQIFWYQQFASSQPSYGFPHHRCSARGDGEAIRVGLSGSRICTAYENNDKINALAVWGCFGLFALLMNGLFLFPVGTQSADTIGSYICEKNWGTGTLETCFKLAPTCSGLNTRLKQHP